MSTYRAPGGRIQVDGGQLGRRERRALAKAARKPRPGRVATLGGRLDLVRTLIRRETVELPRLGGEPPRYAVLPVIPDDATPELAEGMRRRNVATGLDKCPCGAPRIPQPDDDDVIGWAECDHTPDCPAHDTNLDRALTAWSARKLGGA